MKILKLLMIFVYRAKRARKKGVCYANIEGKEFWFRSAAGSLPSDIDGNEYEWSMEFYKSFPKGSAARDWMKINNNVTGLNSSIREVNENETSPLEEKLAKAKEALKQMEARKNTSKTKKGA